MKLEYMADGSIECQLIRLYEFTESKAAELASNIEKLVQGEIISIALHNLDFITPVGGCELTLIVSDFGSGIADSEDIFMCALSAEDLSQVAQSTRPFSNSINAYKYQWLDETGEVSLVLSPSGTW